jgi:carbon starvation protein
MESILLALTAFLVFFLGYRLYSAFLARVIFRLDPDFRTPAHELRDNIDYMPTNKFVLWGHHFTSVAGAAPIIGPAIAVIWGWGPAFLWVILGTVFFAGIHDFSTLWVSVRHKGESMGSLTRAVIGPRARSLFLLIIFFLLLLVNAVFAIAIAQLFSSFPESVAAYWLQIPVAMGVGWLVYQRSVRIGVPALVALLLLLGFVGVGAMMPLALPEQILGLPASAWWVIIMLGYGALASRLPVWLLLQPRDFINAHLLFLVLTLIYLGVFVGAPELVAPMFNEQVPEDAPSMLPLLFVTIACGAISGFHGLVSSGTTSKQLDRETDARFVGYLGATGEGLLAVAAILATTAGFATVGEWNQAYATWQSASDSGIAHFVSGAGSMLQHLGIPAVLGTTFISVLVVAFAATTLDTSMRLQRFILSEIGTQYRMPVLGNRNIATAFVFVACVALAFAGDPDNPGAGGMVLWPLFGTTNQLTAALSLLVVTLILSRLKRGFIYTLVPFLFIAIMTTWAMTLNIASFVDQGEWHLLIIGGIILVFALWLILEGVGAAHREWRDRRAHQG